LEKSAVSSREGFKNFLGSPINVWVETLNSKNIVPDTQGSKYN